MSTNPTTPSQAVDRQILHVAVAQRLRTMIMEGDLAPGTRLNERVLCDLLQVSRTPLREAFKVLAGDGLVTLLPNRGAEVVVLSQEVINHLFEMMGALEAMSGELACQR
ncbi:MAG TPA: GntR family transcriptional regulator, partial [Cupriavidus sp.]|nr:GntR family transcriptional regulator [Cupriavidus sp.]